MLLRHGVKLDKEFHRADRFDLMRLFRCDDAEMRGVEHAFGDRAVVGRIEAVAR